MGGGEGSDMQFFKEVTPFLAGFGMPWPQKIDFNFVKKKKKIEANH